MRLSAIAEKLSLRGRVTAYVATILGLGLQTAALPLWGQTTLYWDTNGNTAGAGGYGAPNGTWDTTTANWTTDSTGASNTSVWTSGSKANFSAGTDGTGWTTITVSGNISTSGVTVDEGTVTFSGGTLSLTGTNPGFTVNSSGNVTVNSTVSGSAGLTKSGSGTLVLGSASNNYTGATNITAGTLWIGAVGALPSATSVSVSSGATLDLGYSGNLTLGTISGAGTVNIRSNTFTIGDSSSTTFSGLITDGGSYGTLVKQGTGTLTLASANSFSGPTLINAGALNVQNSSALGAATYNNVIASGAALQLQGNITLAESNFYVSGSGVGGTGAIRNISGNNTYSGTVTLNASSTIESDGGALLLSNTVATGNYSLTANATGGSIEISGQIQGSGNFIKTGTGTVTLSGSGANSESGFTQVSDGTLILNKTAGTDAVSNAALIVGDGSGAANSAILKLGASNQIPDSVASFTINSDGQFNLNNLSEAVNTIAGTGNINLGTSGDLKIGTGSGSSTWNGTISGNGTLEKAGTGTLTFGQNVTYNGTLNVSGGTAALGTHTVSVNSVVTSNATVIDLGTTGTLKVGNNNGSSTIAGTVTGTGTLEKDGTGTLTFNQNINFNGTLLLSGGTLALNGFDLTVNTLHITGNSILDFGNSSASILNATTFIIDSGVTLTIANWANTVDFFYTQNWTGATFNTKGTTPENQVVFTGFSASSTAWNSSDHQITPVPTPEPATYGAIFIGLGTGLVLWRRRAAARA